MFGCESGTGGRSSTAGTSRGPNLRAIRRTRLRDRTVTKAGFMGTLELRAIL
jgi:hypothetical protein